MWVICCIALLAPVSSQHHGHDSCAHEPTSLMQTVTLVEKRGQSTPNSLSAPDTGSAKHAHQPVALEHHTHTLSSLTETNASADVRDSQVAFVSGGTFIRQDAASHATVLLNASGCWDHSVASYVTNYLIFVTSVICFMLTIKRVKVPYLTSHFIAFLVLVGLTFGFSGLAANVEHAYFRAGETMGHKLFGHHSKWMYPTLAWLLCTGLLSPAIMALMILCFPASSGGPAADASPRSFGVVLAVICAYVVGASVGVYECVNLILGHDRETGEVCSGLLVFSALLFTVSVGIGIFRRGTAHGQVMAFVGAFLMLLGFAILFGDEYYTETRVCPTFKMFSRDAMAHAVIIVSIPCLSYAVWRRIQAYERIVEETRMETYETGIDEKKTKT